MNLLKLFLCTLFWEILHVSQFSYLEQIKFKLLEAFVSNPCLFAANFFFIDKATI